MTAEAFGAPPLPGRLSTESHRRCVVLAVRRTQLARTRYPLPHSYLLEPDNRRVPNHGFIRAFEVV